jgi:feruloyl esterase
VQLPLRANWNGRLVNIGDNGKDGTLNFDNNRVAQGYAVANSNSGHDAAAEPGSSFARDNLDAAIDFGYRAVHLTANASKAVVRAFYGKTAAYAYFDGCSTGGRQGLMEAQRFPEDFDGIVAGAPFTAYTAVNMQEVWIAQKVFEHNFAGNLAFDKDRDGVPESLTKWEILRDAVLAKCDEKDGIKDGVIDDPLSCDFRPEVDLAKWMCAGDVDGDNCFTKRQIQTIQSLYRGAQDSKGNRIVKGYTLGSEWHWSTRFIPHKGNNLTPSRIANADDHVNFLFYEKSPGVPVPVANPNATRYTPNKKATPPEFAWWEFNIDDVTAGKGSLMMSIMDPTDPDLTRFLQRENGKLLLYEGWADDIPVEPIVDYYKSMVAATFGGDAAAAGEKSRLFLLPGVGHCRGGPGPDTWDRLEPLVNWVEKGQAPAHLVVERLTEGKVDNQRKVCPYPQRAVYVGPAGGQNDRANWVEQNFACR